MDEELIDTIDALIAKRLSEMAAPDPGPTNAFNEWLDRVSFSITSSGDHYADLTVIDTYTGYRKVFPLS